MDDSGSFLVRRVEIKREAGKSLGFYIREGDGWLRKDGVFVSRLNLGSIVQTNGLLNVGDEILKVNDVDVTEMPLSDVVLIMKFVKRMVLTVKVLTSFTHTLALHKSLRKRELPKTPSFLARSSINGENGTAEDEDPYSKVTSKKSVDNSVEEKRIRFKRMEEMTESATKTTHFGRSFVERSSHDKGDEANPSEGDNPYEEISHDFKEKLQEERKLGISKADDINPYARVKVIKEGNAVQLKIFAEIHPHKEVTERKSDKKDKTSVNPYKEIEMKPLKDGVEKSAVSSNVSVDDKSHMKMDSFLDLLKSAPLSSSSPFTGRKSDPHDDHIVNPDHIYAQIDRTRKYSSSENSQADEKEDLVTQEKERTLSNVTPPPLPTSPLPKDESMDNISLPVLPLDSSILTDEPENSATEKLKLDGSRRLSLSLRDLVVLPDLMVIDSSKYDDSKHDPDFVPSGHSPSQTIQDHTESLKNEISVESKDGEEEPPPPLPPPYVPDEGPPESSDENEEGSSNMSGSRENKSVENDEDPALVMPLIAKRMSSAAEIEVVISFQDLEEDNVPTKEQVKEATPTTEEIEQLVSTKPLGGSTDIMSLSYSSLTSGPWDDSYLNDTPPPPPPCTEPPEAENLESGGEDGIIYEHLPTRAMSKEEMEESIASSDRKLSGMLVLKVISLDSCTEQSEIFWSKCNVNKVAFSTIVDNRVKVTMTLPILNVASPFESSNSEDEYRVILLHNSQISFSIHPMSLSKLTQTTCLHDIFPTESEGTKYMYVEFEDYGHLKLLVNYCPVSSVIKRLDPSHNGPNETSFSELISNNPRNSGCPLILEKCVEIIEKYGSRTPHLYERCASNMHRHKALLSCTDDHNNQSVKDIVVKCSVHAFTGLVIDFFCNLSEPFFTNDISSSLIQAASIGGEVDMLDNFMQCLPDDVVTTLHLLLGHFKVLCKHSNRNGVTVKSLSKLFGPLLLIPALSSDLNTSTTTLEYAEDYESQARVIELLLSRGTD